MHTFACLIKHLTSYHHLDDWLSWIDELSAKDYVIIDQFLKEETYATVRSDFLAKLPAFKKAGIGASGDHVIRHDIRGDHTHWLDQKRDIHLHDYWSLVEEAMLVFNKFCYLSLSGHEFHFANYPPGSRYEKHLDRFDNRGNRMITIVIYLNKGWKKGDGGELEIFLENDQSLIIDPIESRCVMFKSAEVPHRVIESRVDRYSLTGWLLYQPPGLGQLLT